VEVVHVAFPHRLHLRDLHRQHLVLLLQLRRTLLDLGLNLRVGIGLNLLLDLLLDRVRIFRSYRKGYAALARPDEDLAGTLVHPEFHRAAAGRLRERALHPSRNDSAHDYDRERDS
jgi:hypothetical protein